MEKLLLSQVRRIYEFCDEYGIEPREVVTNIQDAEVDFEVDDYRFISELEIDEILEDELKSDAYILGCFNAWFIGDNTDLSIEIVEALQKGEQYEAIGDHIINNGYLSDFAKAYSGADGYGPHFSSYDGETLEDLIGLNDDLSYYVFRVN